MGRVLGITVKRVPRGVARRDTLKNPTKSSVPVDFLRPRLGDSREPRDEIRVAHTKHDVISILMNKYTYTNGQKKGYTEFMSNYSLVNLKRSIVLTLFESWVYKGIIYSQNTGFRQNGNDIDPSLSMRDVFTK